jgi:hypothetical protein
MAPSSLDRPGEASAGPEPGRYTSPLSRYKPAPHHRGGGFSYEMPGVPTEIEA